MSQNFVGVRVKYYKEVRIFPWSPFMNNRHYQGISTESQSQGQGQG